MSLCANSTASPSLQTLLGFDVDTPRADIWTSDDFDLTQIHAELFNDPEGQSLYDELQVPLHPNATMMQDFGDIHPEVLEMMDFEPDLGLREKEEEDRKPVLSPSPLSSPCTANASVLAADINDDLNATIFDLFPMHALRLERPAFNKWKKANRVRKLDADETKRLAKIRRTMLARVYAERARQKRNQSHAETQSECEQLRSENQKLKEKLAQFKKIFAGR